MFLRTCLSLALLLIWAALARAEEYRDFERHFRFNVADGWRSVPENMLDKVNAEVQKRMPGKGIYYQAGFQLAGRPAMSYPYILLQSQPFSTTNVTYEDIEKDLAKNLNK